MVDDETFGPVIVFGRGGTAVEVIDDKALALPPLDLRLAHEMIGRTRVSRILKAYRDVPAADERAVALVLVKLAQLVADVPEIREVDINPLLADRDGIIAVDARIGVSPSRRLHKGPGHPRFAIRPYPKEWERDDRAVRRRDGVRATGAAGGRRDVPRVLRPRVRTRTCACASSRPSATSATSSSPS